MLAMLVLFFVEVTLPMPTEATTNREELMSYFKLMYTMRRMEITCDTEYKVRVAPTHAMPCHSKPITSWWLLLGLENASRRTLLRVGVRRGCVFSPTTCACCSLV